MCDYCSESEALAEREDDNCELYIDPWDEYYGGTWRDYDYPRRKSVYVGRRLKLGKKIETRKKFAEETKIGNKCRCTMCGKFFEKKSYQQKFCSDKCRVRYHNKRKVYV